MVFSPFVLKFGIYKYTTKFMWQLWFFKICDTKFTYDINITIAAVVKRKHNSNYL